MNNFNPVEKVVELYERLLKEAKDEITILKAELEEFKNKKRSAKTKAGITKPLQSVAAGKQYYSFFCATIIRVEN